MLNFDLIFQEKYFSVNWPNFIVWLTLRLEILSSMCNVIVCCPVGGVINFEINLSFIIKLFSCMIKKVKEKFLNILRMKRAFNMKKKAFFIILKVLSLKQIKAAFLEGESSILKFASAIFYISPKESP